MKITDIVSEYGLRDEPAYGTSKASVRQATAMNTNANKRANNKNADANRELNIANKSLQRRQNRLRIKKPTGIPARILNPQPAQGQQS